MAFTPKDWQDSPSTSTPISAAALEDLETRVTNYTDLRAAGTPKTLLRNAIFALPTTPSAVATNRLYLNRCIVPTTGTLAGVSAWISTSSGNYDVAVYDCGDASTGNLSRLATLGSTAMPAAGGWQEIWTPSLSVTAGQHVYLAIIVDNSTAQLGRSLLGATGGGGLLPAGYMDAPGGIITRFIGYSSPGSFTMPTTIAEGSTADPGTNAIPYLIGRITPS